MFRQDDRGQDKVEGSEGTYLHDCIHVAPTVEKELECV
jgi:hypothetical protein